MSRVEELEQAIHLLSPEEFATLRDWFAEREAEAWDRQFEEDVRAGKLDALAEAARRAHAEGKSTRL